MQINKYRHRSILNLLELNLSQRKHQQHLYEIDRTRRKIRSDVKQSVRHYENEIDQKRASRHASQLYRDIEKVSLINEMNRKINITIEKELTRPCPQQFRYLKKKRREMSVSRSKSSLGIDRNSSIQVENQRLMDRLLSIKPHIKDYEFKQSKRNYQKHIEYKQRIRKYSDRNTRALLQMAHHFGIDHKLAPEHAEVYKKRHSSKWQ